MKIFAMFDTAVQWSAGLAGESSHSVAAMVGLYMKALLW